MIKISIDKEIGTSHWDWFKERANRHFQNTRTSYKDFIINDLKISWNNVKEIITGNIETLNTFKYRLGKITKQMDENRYNKLMCAFGYENFCDSQKEWNAYKMCQELKISVCPYCNREYTFTIGDVNNKGVRPEIDHFFPKSDYPYLSCSLYNFVPSCHICNHGKRDFGEGILYPYKEEFGINFPFRVKFGKESGKSNDLINIDNVQVFFDNKDCKTDQTKREICQKCLKIQKSIKTFHLERIYNEHKIELKDLFDRYRNYCQPKRKDILRLFHEDELKKRIDGLTETQINRILSLYAKKMKNMFLGLPLGAEGKEYPLRKFKEDIIEQFDTTRKKMEKKQPTQ